MAKVQTERTSKKWKALGCLSVIVMIVGAVMWFSAEDASKAAVGMALTLCGIAAHLLARFLAWWNNG